VDLGTTLGDLNDFLARLNVERPNNHNASHFWSFSKTKENFLHFSVPVEVTTLLKKLLLKHGNFMGRFKLGAGFGDFTLALLAAILMDIHHTPFDLLEKGKLFEWMDAVLNYVMPQNLISVCALSPTSGIYWVELGFINNCKEPQL
jgi:hypothetical protein